jgi:hypothetical protein
MSSLNPHVNTAASPLSCLSWMALRRIGKQRIDARHQKVKPRIERGIKGFQQKHDAVSMRLESRSHNWRARY